MNRVLTRWEESVGRAAAELRRLSGAHARRRPAPGKWSVKEIVGHLIDSAANNHRRFVEAQLKDDLVFPGYGQDSWVSRQDYLQAPWPELVTLWAGYNQHLLHVVRAIPAAVLSQPRAVHNLDELGWKPIPRAQPATLGYLIEDYVNHLEHHLAQVRRITPA